MEAARLFEARVLQTGSLSNPTLTWGLIYPLRFHKTELEDLCALFKKKIFKKKKKKKTSVTIVFKLEEFWFFAFGFSARRNVWACIRIGIPFALFYEFNLGFSKKKKKRLPSLLDSNMRNPGSFLFGLRARGNRWVFVRIGIPLLSFANLILTFQKSHLVSFSKMQFTTFVPSGASTPFRVYCIRDWHICISNLISFYLEWASLLGNLN